MTNAQAIKYYWNILEMEYGKLSANEIMAAKKHIDGLLAKWNKMK